MRLYGLVTEVGMKKFPHFDEKTGIADPNYLLQLVVADADNRQSVYQCSVNGGFGLEALKEARERKASEAERDQIAAQIEAHAKGLLMQQAMLVITRVRTKGFVSFTADTAQLVQSQ
jgi:hypothetical protein